MRGPDHDEIAVHRGLYHRHSVGAKAGTKTGELCRRHGISSATFYVWKAKFGGTGMLDAKRLKALEEDSVPRCGVGTPTLGEVRASSGGHGGQPDVGIVGDVGKRFKRHIAPCDRPFVVGLQHQRTDEADDGLIIGEDADHVCAPLHLAIHLFEWIGRGDLGLVLAGERPVGQDVVARTSIKEPGLGCFSRSASATTSH